MPNIYNIRKPATALVAIIPLLLGLLFASPSYAAGGGGGGGLGSIPADAGRQLTPEQQSAKSLKSGIRLRDKALKAEAKAAKAKTDKARDKQLARAQKQFKKAIEKQGRALQQDPRNYKAANELGFALRKTGDYRRAIGAYNYALEINPDYHQATEYRAEAFLALGLLKQTQESYMLLFRNDRDLANMLMGKIDAWAAAKQTAPEGSSLSESETAFIDWANERKNLAKLTNDLSMNNTRTW